MNPKPNPDAFKKKLTVVEQKELVSWPNKKGKSETVLYELKAVDEDGNPWEPRPLRSFALMELDVPFEYDIEPYTHPQTGERSMTVKRPRQNTTQRVAYLEEQMQDAFDRIAALEAKIAALPSGVEKPLGDIPEPPPLGLGGRTF